MQRNVRALSIKQWMLMVIVLVAVAIPCGAMAVTKATAYGILIQEGGFPEASDIRSKGVVTDAFRQKLIRGWENMDASIDVSEFQINKSDIMLAYFGVLNDNPQMFYVGNGVNYYYDESDLLTSFSPEYTMTIPEVVQAEEIVQAETENILSNIQPGMSVVEKIIVVNDYFCLNYEYDTDLKIRDIYQLFLNKKGVCQAYALGFLHIMKQLNIPCTTALSDKPKMNHIWNVVQVDGAWYHVDVTWDDPLWGDKDCIGYVSHAFMLLSDAAISDSDHNHYGWVCDHEALSTKYDNYFWSSVTSAFSYSDGKLYYIDANDNIYSYDMSTGTTTLVKSIDQSLMYGFGRLDGMLLYQTGRDFYAYDPATDKTILAAIADGIVTGSQYVVGFRNVGNTVYFSYGNSTPTANAQLTISLLLGDVNSDGKDNNRDAVMMLRHNENLGTLNRLGKARADVNGDGKIDDADVLALLCIMCGKVS